MAAILVCALAVPLVLAGCAPSNMDVNSYVVKQSGKEVGSQKVTIEDITNGVSYSSTESMPFTEFGTTFTRKLTVAKDLKSTLSYQSTEKVPGAAYTSDLQNATVGDGFGFFANDLQTFEWVPQLTVDKKMIAYEPLSVCTAQALLDRFLSANVPNATALVVIPSRSPVPREILVDRPSKFVMRITSQGIDEVDVTFDKNSFVTGLHTGSFTIAKASPGSFTAMAYQPVTKGTTFSEVSVGTTQKLAGGGKLDLAGSFYLPVKATKPYRAVILTGDEGPQDRTGGGFLSQVADALAGQGMVVLTCDRRGVPKSGGSYATDTRSTLLSDIDSQVDYLVGRGDIDTNKIALVGYGEGGLLSATAATTNPYVKRLVLMATPSVTLFPDLMRTQVDEAASSGALLPSESGYQQHLIDQMIAAVNSTPARNLSVGGHNVFLDWMRSWMAATPPADLAALKVPVLVMQGTADDVVPAAQAAQIMQTLAARAGGQQQLAQFDGLGHSFGKELSQAASKPNRMHPQVDPKVLDALTTWLKAN